MSDNDEDVPFSDALLQEAGQWLARMDGQDADRHREDFEKWRGASPDHGAAYDWIKAREAAVLSAPPSPKVQTWIDELDGLPKRSAPLARRPWLWAGSAIAAGLILTLGIRSLPSGMAPGNNTELAGITQSYLARRGEIRRLKLTDGSTVTLDTGSKVEVAIGRTERKVHLAQGHARFEVVSDPRPFRVEAGAGVVTAQSQAVFDVGIERDRQVLVQLVSGQADVRPALRSAVLIVPARSMASGQYYAYAADQYQPAPVPQEALFVDKSRWPTGWVDVHSISLDALIAEANRYAALPIIMDDPDAGQLSVTGRFKVSDTDSFLAKIADAFQFKIDRRPDGIHLRPK